MLDHVRLSASDYDRPKRFYAAALAPLGSSLLVDEGDADFEPARKPQFWIGSGRPAASVHMAFLAADRAAVRAFYGAALAAGGRSNGSPGLRPHYHPNYYAAFVLDPMATTSRRFVTCRAPSTISAERCEARVAATPRAGIGGRYLEGV